jgi:hypothetical protein
MAPFHPGALRDGTKAPRLGRPASAQMDAWWSHMVYCEARPYSAAFVWLWLIGFAVASSWICTEIMRRVVSLPQMAQRYPLLWQMRHAWQAPSSLWMQMGVAVARLQWSRGAPWCWQGSQ